jgi:hypothetical protein
MFIALPQSSYCGKKARATAKTIGTTVSGGGGGAHASTTQQQQSQWEQDINHRSSLIHDMTVSVHVSVTD